MGRNRDRYLRAAVPSASGPPGPPGSGGSGGGLGTGPPRTGSPEPQPRGGAPAGLAAELARHPIRPGGRFSP